MKQAAPRSSLTLAAALLASAFFIGEIGDTFGAWNSFSEWLFGRLGLPTDSVVDHRAFRNPDPRSEPYPR